VMSRQWRVRSRVFHSTPHSAAAMLTVGFVVPPRFQTMGLTAVSAFELANTNAQARLYDIRLLSEHGGPVPNSLGIPIQAGPLAGDGLDTLIVCGLLEPAPTSAGLIDQLRRASATTRRIASVCTGAFLLGEAGLLDGRRATTHWRYVRTLQEWFPKALVEDDRIFVVDAPIWTSAGMSADLDLALAMIEKDFGSDLARNVARSLVVRHRRGAGDSQHSTLLELHPRSDRIQCTLEYARRNLRATLSVEALAEAAHLSPRQFSRAFRAETGQSPAKAVENLRIEAARVMVEQSRHTMDEVAIETGFADTERMRRAFLRAFGQPPQAIRRNARLAAA